MGSPGFGRRPSEADAPGLIAGRYRVERVLGRGGMGAVVQVFDQSGQKSLALKRPSREATGKQLALFEREYHTLAGINHPHIVEVYDYGADAEGPFYTMELLEGSDLSTHAPMPWEQVCRVLYDVASALALVHVRRLLHRDLSARNVWRGADGRIKLIDFGALAAFGAAPDITGTPPFLAPEALDGQQLDQRTDLFSLGALGYWLLTGRHAFNARSLSELTELWQRAPRAPSSVVRSLARPDLGEPPVALDALIDALLSREPLGRPSSAADVLERLVSIANLTPEKQAFVVDSYLGSAAFVGRRAERQELSRAIDRVLAGTGAALVIDAPSGMGRSRLLTELALEARLRGLVVLNTGAQSGKGSYEAIGALATRVLDALPDLARASASPHAPTLGHLSPELAKRLGMTPATLAPIPSAPGEARMRVQAALRAWFLDIATTQPLAILVDDYHALDEASAAWVAALAHELGPNRILLVVTRRSGEEDPTLPALDALRSHATSLRLEPLSRAQTAELLRSMFGEAVHLERVADILFRVGHGSPAYVMELAEHLVRTRLALYLNGSWILPQTLEDARLPATRDEILVARLRRLPDEARALCQIFSVHERSIPLALCSALSELEPRTMFGLLELLVAEGVLVGSADGYRFSHEGLRRIALSELDPQRARRAHRVLGDSLLSAARTTVGRIEAGVHLLLAGDFERGSQVVCEAGTRLGSYEPAEVGPAAPWLIQALDIYRALGRPDAEQIALIVPLALAGYYVDRRLADRYGDEAVAKVTSLLRLPLARRLRPWLGRKLAIAIALLTAAVSIGLRQKSKRVPDFRSAFMMMFNCVVALCGVATICIDAGRANAYAAAIEPLTALGKSHIATFMHRFCLNLAATVEDHIDAASNNWTRVLEQFDGERTVPGLPDNVRTLYVAGALYARGVIECWRDDSLALSFADRLDALKLRLYEMSADQLRMMYYGNRGNIELFEHYRQRVEVHAIERGTAWQVETWASAAAITVHLRTQDAARMRLSDEQLRAWSRDVPSLMHYGVRSRGALLLLRGMPSEALPHLERVLREPVQGIVGWGRSMGALARAYNELGAHSTARDVTQRALATLSAGDLDFAAMNMGVLVEQAKALAGLGQLDEAGALLDALLEKHGPHVNALTLGALHEGRAHVATLAKDGPLVERHLTQMEHWYRLTRAPSLIERSDRLWKLARPRKAGPSETPGLIHDAADLAGMLRAGRPLGTQGVLRWCIEIIAAQLGSTSAALYVESRGVFRRVADVGELPPGIDDWARRHLTTDDPDTMHEALDDDDHREAASLPPADNESFRALTIYAKRDAQRVLGGLLLPSEHAARLATDVLRALGERLELEQGAETEVQTVPDAAADG